MKTPFKLPATKYSPEAQISAALYTEDDGLCLYTTDETGERQLTITFNAPEIWHNHPDLAHVRDRALFIKGWSENEGVLEAFRAVPELYSAGPFDISKYMPHGSQAHFYFTSPALTLIRKQLLAKQQEAAA